MQTEVIARQSGGFPFFIHELVRFLRDGRELSEGGGPTGDVTLGGVLWERTLRLPESSRRLLAVVAVAGRPLAVAEAVAAAGVEDPAGALAQLRNERLVRRTASGQGEQIETYHDRIREAMVLHLPAEVQAGHHLRLAELLEAGGAAEPEWLAVHFLGAGQSARAGRYFALAAERAASALAFDRAAKMYRQALQLQDLAPAERRQTSARLGDALTRRPGGRGRTRIPRRGGRGRARPVAGPAAEGGAGAAQQRTHRRGIGDLARRSRLGRPGLAGHVAANVLVAGVAACEAARTRPGIHAANGAGGAGPPTWPGWTCA